MTDQQPQPPYNILDLGAKFGAQEAILYGQIITLEKRIAILETSIAQMEAELVDLEPLRATIREQKSRPD